MLKCAFNRIVDSRFIRKLAVNESVKCFFYSDHAKNLSSSHFLKFTSFFQSPICNRGYSEHPNFRRYKEPVILLGGILTFLGLKEKTLEEKESELIMTIKKGILLIQRGKFDQAEQVLHVALKLAQDQNDADGITYTYDILANLAFETNQYEKAEKLFVTVLQRLLGKGEAEDSNAIIHISLKMAKMYQKRKDHKKAEVGYKYCIDNLNDKLENGDEDTLALWGMSMDWYGRFLLEVNRTNEALDCLKKAYEMCVKVKGLESEQTVVLLNDLGMVSKVVGDSESAVKYLEEAKKIVTKFPEMKDQPFIYINLGQLYLLKNMYNESKLACQEGLKKAKIFEDQAAFTEATQCLSNVNKVFKAYKTQKNFKAGEQILVN